MLTLSRTTKSIILGLVTALAGLIIGILPFGVSLEEGTGLSLLFRLRGSRPVPSEVVVVSIDKRSSDELGLKNDPRKWPRALHAELIDRIMASGASGIAFDIFFEEPRSGRDDLIFADAIQRSGRVILCQRLLAERSDAPDGSGLYTERLVSPVSALEKKAFALAPFPMPKVALSVIRNWMFKTSAGDAPTLPIVSFQLFAIDAYEDFLAMLRQTGTAIPKDLPGDKLSVMKRGAMVYAIQEIRTAFEKDPDLETKMLRLLDEGRHGGTKLQRLRSLIGMYSGDARKYLNFYGPPGSVQTIPYDHMLGTGKTGLETAPDLKGKMVFVGFSELYQPEQKDTFFTVFSQEDGRDISGIELAATEFANLIEDMPVKPLSFGLYLTVMFCWGFVMGAVCKTLSPIASGVVAIFSAILYLFFAFSLFKTSGVWYPVLVPAFIQPTFAFVGALLWKYADANRERKNIRNAFGYYLPGDVVDRLAKNMTGLRTDSKAVQGVCLYTDAEGYTSLAETMDSQKLGRHMNQYYEMVFSPIKEHGGTISNVVGDSVLALWLGTETDKKRLSSACSAALEISRQMLSFEDRVAGSYQLPTRIGVHAGQIMLGNVGAADHFEYRPVGDIVNATTRLDGLNKLLATRILISESVAEHLEGFVIREIGTFLVKGKASPMKVYELICRKENAEAHTGLACSAFSEALSLFRQGSWKEAQRGFSACRKAFGEDGPARFYLDLCSRYLNNPPEGEWDGVIRMDYK
ncbi:MAG: adenylate/guanylate cyclase domain-containing protein [Nitrospirae bacterium]|nr:adenylate/guanylate cyclase domain-containing protein [Nitrospirota bacterium]